MKFCQAQQKFGQNQRSRKVIKQDYSSPPPQKKKNIGTYEFPVKLFQIK